MLKYSLLRGRLIADRNTRAAAYSAKCDRWRSRQARRRAKLIAAIDIALRITATVAIIIVIVLICAVRAGGVC